MKNLAKLVFKSPYILQNCVILCEIKRKLYKFRENRKNLQTFHCFESSPKFRQNAVTTLARRCRKQMPFNRILIAQLKRLMFSLSIRVYRRIIIVFKCQKVRPPPPLSESKCSRGSICSVCNYRIYDRNGVGNQRTGPSLRVLVYLRVF